MSRRVNESVSTIHLWKCEMTIPPTPLTAIAQTPRKELESKFTFNPVLAKLTEVVPSDSTKPLETPTGFPSKSNSFPVNEPVATTVSLDIDIKTRERKKRTVRKESKKETVIASLLSYLSD
ncbi:hypothetical protein HZH68_006415 [Vespula germanica]|uniref:Uncharacterized protein n=1 Tax=Vespula germanica TaxID=30212 RepID=A0A834KGM3_VESGE|nr:hypothetical protein HZH68_006415 [Vespula germanica]